MYSKDSELYQLFSRRRHINSAVAFFFATAIISLNAPVYSQPSRWDVSVFRTINDSRSSLMDHLVGSNDYTVLPMAVSLPLAFSAGGMLTKTGYTVDTGIMIGVTEASAFAVYYVMKNVIFRRERPYAALSNVHTMHIDSADKYSMPSGHSTAAFAIATTLALRYPKPYVYIPAYAWAILVGYGRIYMGLHYPSDVIAGAALGSASAIAVSLLGAQITDIRKRIIGNRLGITLTLVPPAEINLRLEF
ncbi:MAG: phosphatase PAP2 family protein [Candidatus Kryptoniota bacterium]